MFKFSTNTLINSATMPDGSPRFYTTNDGTVLRIKKHFQFRDQNVVGVYKRCYEAPQLAQVSIDMSAITKPGVYRIALYLRLSGGSQNSYFSNDFVFKGKPFFIEFYAKASKNDPTALADDAATIAKRVERIAKKYLNMVYEFPLVDVKADGEKVILTASDEYQRFKMVRLEWYDDEAKSYDCCANFGRFEGEDDIDEMSPVYAGKIEYTKDDAGKERVGHEGFGTFIQISKDLRLPTAANTRWNRIVIDETPMLHGKYNEYVIKYCVNRGIMGSDAVGEVTKSLTNHVFYVESAVVPEWEEALKAIIGEGDDIKTEVETVNKDKDDKRLISTDKETYSDEDIATALGNTENDDELVDCEA